MKTYIYTILIGLTLLSCGGDDTGGENTGNKAPTVPTIIAPNNELYCTDNIVTFEWNKSEDPEGDYINYYVEISEDNQFSEISYSAKAKPLKTTVTVAVNRGITYYWRVKAKDTKGNASYSETFNFYTEGTGISNRSPYNAALVSPELDASIDANGGSVELNWTGSDVDTDDTLTYDIYFGTETIPVTKVASDQSSTNYSATVSAGEEYFWRVDVKDNHGAVTEGQIWSFITN